MLCAFVLTFYKLLVKKHKIVLEKACFQRGFEFFKNISFIKKNVEHQKNKSTQPAITCSKLTIETLEQGVKYVQS